MKEQTRADLNYADLHGADLTGVFLLDTHLKKAKF